MNESPGSFRTQTSALDSMRPASAGSSLWYLPANHLKHSVKVTIPHSETNESENVSEGNWLGR